MRNRKAFVKKLAQNCSEVSFANEQILILCILNIMFEVLLPVAKDRNRKYAENVI